MTYNKKKRAVAKPKKSGATAQKFDVLGEPSNAPIDATNANHLTSEQQTTRLVSGDLWKDKIYEPCKVNDSKWGVPEPL